MNATDLLSQIGEEQLLGLLQEGIVEANFDYLDFPSGKEHEMSRSDFVDIFGEAILQDLISEGILNLDSGYEDYQRATCISVKRLRMLLATNIVGKARSVLRKEKEKSW